jgi:hypothetical protein
MGTDIHMAENERGRRLARLRLLRALAPDLAAVFVPCTGLLVYLTFYAVQPEWVALFLPFALPATLSWLLWRFRRVTTREHLRDVEQGRACIGCDAYGVQLEGGLVVCHACGHRAELQVLQAEPVDQEELKRIQRSNHKRIY